MIDTLRDLERDCRAHGVPLLGPKKGAWLHKQVGGLRPKSVLELGTAWGYSGCILASCNAQLTAIDWDWRSFKRASEEFEAHGVDAELILGDVMEVVPKLAGRGERYDLIFMDCEKRFYLPLLEPCIALLGEGGHLIIDNIDHERAQDCKRQADAHPSLEVEHIPLQDGLLLCRKRQVL